MTPPPIIEEKGPSFVVFDKTQNDITTNSNLSQLLQNKHLLKGFRQGNNLQNNYYQNQLTNHHSSNMNMNLSTDSDAKMAKEISDIFRKDCLIKEKEQSIMSGGFQKLNNSFYNYLKLTDQPYSNSQEEQTSDQHSSSQSDDAQNQVLGSDPTFYQNKTTTLLASNKESQRIFLHPVPQEQEIMNKGFNTNQRIQSMINSSLEDFKKEAQEIELDLARLKVLSKKQSKENILGQTVESLSQQMTIQLNQTNLGLNTLGNNSVSTMLKKSKKSGARGGQESTQTSNRHTINENRKSVWSDRQRIRRMDQSSLNHNQDTSEIYSQERPSERRLFEDTTNTRDASYNRLSQFDKRQQAISKCNPMKQQNNYPPNQQYSEKLYRTKQILSSDMKNPSLFNQLDFDQLQQQQYQVQQHEKEVFNTIQLKFRDEIQSTCAIPLPKKHNKKQRIKSQNQSKGRAFTSCNAYDQPFFPDQGAYQVPHQQQMAKSIVYSNAQNRKHSNNSFIHESFGDQESTQPNNNYIQAEQRNHCDSLASQDYIDTIVDNHQHDISVTQDKRTIINQLTEDYQQNAHQQRQEEEDDELGERLKDIVAGTLQIIQSCAGATSEYQQRYFQSNSLLMHLQKAQFDSVNLGTIDQMMKQMAQDLCEKGITIQKLEIDNEQNKQMAISLNQNLSTVMRQNDKVLKKYRRVKHRAHKLKKALNEQQHILSVGTITSPNDMTVLSNHNNQNLSQNHITLQSHSKKPMLQPPPPSFFHSQHQYQNQTQQFQLQQQMAYDVEQYIEELKRKDQIIEQLDQQVNKELNCRINCEKELDQLFGELKNFQMDYQRMNVLKDQLLQQLEQTKYGNNQANERIRSLETMCQDLQNKTLNQDDNILCLKDELDKFIHNNEILSHENQRLSEEVRDTNKKVVELQKEISQSQTTTGRGPNTNTNSHSKVNSQQLHSYEMVQYFKNIFGMSQDENEEQILKKMENLCKEQNKAKSYQIRALKGDHFKQQVYGLLSINASKYQNEEEAQAQVINLIKENQTQKNMHKSQYVYDDIDSEKKSSQLRGEILKTLNIDEEALDIEIINEIKFLVQQIQQQENNKFSFNSKKGLTEADLILIHYKEVNGLTNGKVSFEDMKDHMTKEKEFTLQIRQSCQQLKRLLGLDKKLTPQDTLGCLQIYIERQTKKNQKAF